MLEIVLPLLVGGTNGCLRRDGPPYYAPADLRSALFLRARPLDCGICTVTLRPLRVCDPRSSRPPEDPVVIVSGACVQQSRRENIARQSRSTRLLLLGARVLLLERPSVLSSAVRPDGTASKAAPSFWFSLVLT